MDGLFRGVAVLFLALLVLGVDALADVGRLVLVLHNEETHGLAPALHSAGGVDARAHIEHQVGDGDHAGENRLLLEGIVNLDAGLVKDGLDAHTGELVDNLEAEMGEDAVLAGDGHDVGGDADGHKVHTGEPELVGQLVLLAIALDELEAHTATGEFFIGIGAVLALGVEDGHGGGQFVTLKMVVADDDVDAQLVGHLHLVVGLDAAVE